MQENYNNAPYEEEEGLDILELVKGLWDGRKTILICTAVFVVLGLIAALTQKPVYNVNAVMVPQINSRSNSSLSSLASLAGFDLGSSTTATDLSPVVYPQIVNSVPFRLELINTPYHYAKADTAVTMLTYAKEYNKPSVMSYILKYTVGLPGVIMGAIRGNKKEEAPALPSSGEEGMKPLVLTKDEARMVAAVGQKVNLSVDRKEGYLTLSVSGSEPIQTAELGTKALTLLQEEITRFRTDKVKNELDYIQARYDEVKKEAESLQGTLAVVTDRSQNMPTTRSRIEQERIQSKYSIANAVYMEMAKQLEQAKMQVKKETPVFAVVQPIMVPRQPSNSRAKTLVIWVFLGAVLGCGIVLGKQYLPKLKEMLASEEETPEN